MLRRILGMMGIALVILMVVAMGDNAQTAAPFGSGKIVFVSNRDPDFLQVYLMNVDGSAPIQLTHSAGANHCPTFSPDGRKIAFTSDREGSLQIYVMNVDGSSVARLTNPPIVHGCAAYSPDGRRMAFSAGRSPMGMDFAIYTMNSDGSGITQLTRSPVGTNSPPRFSPNGRKILFEGGNGLSTMNPDGSDAARLNTPGLGCNDAIFNQDGDKIVAACVKPGESSHIYIMNPDGTNMVRLTDAVHFRSGGSYPAISSDGRKIAFWAQPDPQRGVQIFIMNTDGSDVTSLTSPSVYSFDPAFSP